MSTEAKAGMVERGAKFLEKLNLFVGAVALAGALIAPPGASEFFTKVLMLQVVEAMGWITIRSWLSGKQPKLA